MGTNSYHYGPNSLYCCDLATLWTEQPLGKNGESCSCVQLKVDPQYPCPVDCVSMPSCKCRRFVACPDLHYICSDQHSATSNSESTDLGRLCALTTLTYSREDLGWTWFKYDRMSKLDKYHNVVKLLFSLLLMLLLFPLFLLVVMVAVVMLPLLMMDTRKLPVTVAGLRLVTLVHLTTPKWNSFLLALSHTYKHTRFCHVSSWDFGVGNWEKWTCS